MKKRQLFYSFAAFAMSFMATACSGNDEPQSIDNSDDGVQQIVLQVSSNGAGLQSRAGRPLLSNEPGQDIQKVALVIVDNNNESDNKGKIVYTTAVDWKDASSYNHGKMKTVSLTGNDKLNHGSFKIYAYGYSNPSDYKEFSFTKDTDFNENGVIAEYTDNKSTPEEIFGGSEDFTVDSDGFSTTLVLNRQVAGAYFYVYNLPMLDGLDTSCKLQLVASDVNDQLVLGCFANYDITGNGTGNDGHINYVVNGKKSAENISNSKVICEAKISDWYSDIKDANNDGIVDVIKTQTDTETTYYWITTAEANKEGSTNSRQGKGGAYVKGSVFASNFVFPFQKVDDQQTLTLKLVKSDGTEIHHWNVNLPQSEFSSTLTAYGTNGFAAVKSYSESKNYYSIVRNHLYSVGAKTKDGTNPGDNPGDNPTPNPEDPDEPTPDPDEPNNPQDLSKDQNIILRVNHNWEVIHKMELD